MMASPFSWTLELVRNRLSEIGIGEEFPADGYRKHCNEGKSKTNARQQTLREKGRVASVLVLISSDLNVLLTLRSQKLKSHPGQVSFPGGKQDPSDGGDDVLTALRETKEEVGLDYISNGSYRVGRDRKKAKTDDSVDCCEEDHGFTILCRMQTVEAIGNLCVVPIVAMSTTKTWKELHHELKCNEDEVETAFWAPLSVFSETHCLKECYEVPDWPVDGESFVYRSYDYEFPLTKKKFSITGLTAGILHEVAMSVCEGKHREQTRNASTEGGGMESTEEGGNSGTKSSSGPPLRGTLKRRVVRESKTKQRPFQWTEAFFVLLENSGSNGGGILHQYDSVEHALRKQQAATKKNRLRLMPNTPSDNSYTLVEEIEEEPNQDFPFRISTLNGRIQWELSASTKNERSVWIDRIRSIVG